jgi:hypothetical protein
MSFYTEVIQKHPAYKKKERCASLDLLEPVTRAHAEAILAELGPEWMLYETFRSKERQSNLFSLGTTDLQRVGVHHYGLAFDIVRNDAKPGKKPIPTWLGNFSPLVQAAVARGLVAGLRRKSGSVDFPHVQRIRVLDQKKLFDGTWYPGADYEARLAV